MKRLCTLVLFVFLLVSPVFSQIVMTAAMDGGQETPPVTTVSKGTAWVVVYPDLHSVTYQVTYARLQGTYTGSHFHLGAAGVGGPVIQGISFTGNTSAGTWSNVPDSIIVHFIKGDMYINVHSSTSPGGEIRGQVLPVKGVAFLADMNGSQETPPNSSTGRGTAYLIIDSTGKNATYRITLAGLSSTFQAAHFHMAAVGVAGGVVQGISFSDSTASGSWTNLSSAYVAALVKNGIYVNAHTSLYGGGEIRGQLYQTGDITFSINLNGSQETPPVTTVAQGTGFGVLNSTKDTLTVLLTYARLQGSYTGSHIHLAAPGVGGPVLFPITYGGGNTAILKVGNLADSIIAYALSGYLYANVHSNTSPGGEIRGQLKLNSLEQYYVSLSGTNSIPSNNSTAGGIGYFLYDYVTNSLNYQFTFAGLSSAFQASHFHSGTSVQNGGVVQPISVSDSTVAGTWSNLSSTNLQNLVYTGIYVNVHTTNFPSGEIRSQVMHTYQNPTINSILFLNAALEGFFDGTNYINDTMKVELHNNTTPYALVQSKSAFLTNGSLSAVYGGLSSTAAYYLVLKHRNAVETWSATAKSFSSGLLSYNFTSDSAKAFGNNMIKKGSKWCFYGGDVNQDGTIDISDMVSIDNDSYNFVGGYVNTDVNGDNTVDITDMVFVDNNSFKFIGVQKPAGKSNSKPLHTSKINNEIK